MNWRTGIEKLLTYACIAAAAVHVGVFIYVAASRMPYPYSIDGMEGGMLVQVHRVLAGQPLYTRPTIEFASFMYTPLFYWTSAAFALVLGNSFTPLRLVSMLAILGSIALIFAWVKWRTKNWIAAAIAAGCFAACYAPSGYYFDPGRVDPLALFWILATLYLVIRADGMTATVVAGCCAAAAFQTKQSELIVVLAAVLIAFLRDWQRGIVFAAATTIALGGTFWTFNNRSDGWYAFFTVEMPLHQSLIKGSWLTYWTTDLLKVLPVASLFAVAALVMSVRTEKWEKTAIEVAAFGSLIFCSWMGRIHAGGWSNVLLPAYAALSVALGLGYARLRGSNNWFATNWGGVALAALCLVQFGLNRPDPRKQIPTAEDREGGDTLMRVLKTLPQDVWIPDHGYLAEMGGKKPFVHRFAAQDLLWSSISRVHDPFEKEVKEALEHERFSALIMDNQMLNATGQYKALAAPTYRYVGAVPYKGEEFETVVGWPMRPQFVFRPGR